MAEPVLVMIAGPNGSGKTTLTERLRAAGFDLGEYINADDISVGLAGDSADVSREAQRLAEERRQSCLARGVSFSFETVMSHPSKIALLHQARALGYFIQLFFVGVEDPRINVDRVAQRVALGGHDVPIDRIIHRYERTMALLPEAIHASDRTVLFDNSHSDHDGGAVFALIAEATRSQEGDLQVGFPGNLPAWSIAPIMAAMGRREG